MRLLNKRRAPGRYREQIVAQAEEVSASLSRKRDGSHIHRARLLKSSHYVGRVSRSAESYEDGAGLSVCFDLPGKDRLEGLIVGPSGENGGIRRETDHIQSFAVREKSAHHFAGDVHGIGGGSTVAADQHGLPGAQRSRDSLQRPGHELPGPRLAGQFQNSDGFGKVTGQTHSLSSLRTKS